MAVVLFQVPLTLRPLSGGAAQLVPPAAFQGLRCTYLQVKDGAEEAIVEVEGSDAELAAAAKVEACRKLSPKQADALRRSYPAPKLKQKYRLKSAAARTGVVDADAYERDAEGRQIVDTVQLVRSRFYLIEVAVRGEA